eukprot:6109146-Amphidinium_carterae.1
MIAFDKYLENPLQQHCWYNCQRFGSLFFVGDVTLEAKTCIVVPKTATGLVLVAEVKVGSVELSSGGLTSIVVQIVSTSPGALGIDTSRYCQSPDGTYSTRIHSKLSCCLQSSIPSLGAHEVQSHDENANPCQELALQLRSGSLRNVKMTMPRS